MTVIRRSSMIALATWAMVSVVGCSRTGYDSSTRKGDHAGANVAGDTAPAGDDAPPCVDNDNDGYLPAGCPGTLPDCADDDATRHPGAREICDNGIDEDCQDGDLVCAGAVPELNTDNSGPVTVSNIDFVLSFEPSAGGVLTDVRLPMGSNQNILYSGFEKNERLCGISHFDEQWFSWRPDTPVPINPLESGVAAVQLELDWSAGEITAADGMHGTSRYTIYPDGRIHRDERVVVNESVGHSWFLAYAAISVDHWDTASWDSQTSGSWDLVGTCDGCELYEGNSTDLGWGCSTHSTTNEVVGWSHHTAGTAFMDGYRFWEVGMGSATTHSLLLASEWHRDAGVPSGAYHGHIMMTVSASGVCDGVIAAAAAFQNPATLTPSVGALVTGSAGDDDADGFNEGDGAYVLSAAGGKEIQFSIAATVTLPTSSYRLEAADFTFDPAVELNSSRLQRGDSYLIDVDANRQGAWLFVSRSLVDGDQLRIVAP